MRKFLSAAAALTVLATTAPAFADTALVRFGDLDLSSASGKSELQARIERAAVRVCTQHHETGTIIGTVAPSKACLADARRQIAAQVEAQSKVGLGG